VTHPLMNLTTWIAALSLCACAHSTAANPREASAPGKQIITADEIAKSGLNNAWDLLRKRALGYDFSEDRYGRPRAIRTRRGRTSISVRDGDAPLVIIDGARVTDVGALRDLSTDAIDSIELLNGISGTASQGTNASAGVIYIHTREASVPRAI
jgi:outer membrane cobalamin receptor